MFIQLLKRFSLVGFLLTVAILSLYIHTSINTDYIPEEYNVYALVYGHFGETNSSSENIKNINASDKNDNELDLSEDSSEDAFFDKLRLKNNI